MNVNTTTATLTQNDLNHLAADEQDFIRYQDLMLLAEKNGLSVEDALFYAEESLDKTLVAHDPETGDIVSISPMSNF